MCVRSTMVSMFSVEVNPKIVKDFRTVHTICSDVPNGLNTLTDREMYGPLTSTLSETVEIFPL